jgi:hypothetical protein
VLCHCRDCHKISGGLYSINFLVPAATFRLNAGTTKVHTKSADSGVAIDSHFCGECSSMMWRESIAYPGVKIVKAGTLDDGAAICSAGMPDGEVFTRSRVAWVQAVPGATQSPSS